MIIIEPDRDPDNADWPKRTPDTDAALGLAPEIEIKIIAAERHAVRRTVKGVQEDAG